MRNLICRVAQRWLALSRTVTIVQLAASYAVALVLGSVAIFIIEGAAMSAGQHVSVFLWLVYAAGLLLLLVALLRVAAVSLAALVRLFRSVASA